MPEPITLDEWRKELDAFRNTDGWTDEMTQVLLLARDNPHPVPFARLEQLFEKHGWPFKRSAIQDRYARLKAK